MRMGVEAGSSIHEERVRRHLSLSTLANKAGVSTSHLAEVEAGVPASLETYARVMTALGLQAELRGADPRGRSRPTPADEDYVHAAMGDIQAVRLSRNGFEVAIDEPYQHYQFAGRADVVAWDRSSRALLHIENRTRFPNVQNALGSYSAKRAYLGKVLTDRLGIRGGWASETHVIAALWSSEVIHVLRLRDGTFRAACPDPVDAFRAWWAGDVTGLSGRTSALALFDPGLGVREAFRLGELPGDRTRSRYRGYAEAAQRLRSGGRNQNARENPDH